MSVKIDNTKGFTCGLRSNGDRCVLWDDETRGDKGFEWFSKAEFAQKFGE